MELTKEQEEEYLRDPNYCPGCGSDQISAGDNNDGSIKVSCVCGASWYEIYTITCIAGFEPGDTGGDEEDEALRTEETQTEELSGKILREYSIQDDIWPSRRWNKDMTDHIDISK